MVFSVCMACLGEAYAGSQKPGVFFPTCSQMEGSVRAPEPFLPSESNWPVN